MKNFTMILAAFSMGTAPIQGGVDTTAQPFSSEITAKIEGRSLLGQTAVASVRADYEEGSYDSFLKELDDAFHVAQENNELDSFAASRPGLSAPLLVWEGRVSELQDEKRRELLSAVEQQGSSLFVEKVKSVVAAGDWSEEEKDAIWKMNSFRQMVPGEGRNNDENLLIELDLEYEYKALQIDLPGASTLEKREKQCALKMEKLDCLRQLSEQFQDSSLKEAVAIYAKGFDARLAQGWDAADLNNLANGKWKSSNALEEKIASILGIYQEKLSDLTKKFMAEHERENKSF